MKYIYSTATCSQYYCLYENAPDSNLAVIKKRVLINGGHGVASNKVIGNVVWTPKGAVTAVSDDDYEILKNNDAFRRHCKAGFIIVDDKKVKPEKRVADMKDKDKSAPMTRKDFKGSNKHVMGDSEIETLMLH